MEKIRIATVGDNCMDSYDDIGIAYPGGNPVNVAVYIARLGGQAAYIGAVGTDAYGSQMMTAIESKHVDISHIKVLEGTTAVTHVEIVDGDRVLGDYDEGVMADFKIDEKDIDFLAGFDMVVSGLWGMIENELPAIRAKGVPVAFDFATKPEDPVTKKAIGHVDYAFFSDDSLDDEAAASFIRQMQAKGPKVVVLTRGIKGSMAYDGENYYNYGIVKCPVVDTMGAGDSFIAGFLYAICQGKATPEAMAEGAKSSAVTLGYEGAW